MATLLVRPTAMSADHRFFLKMAIAMAIIIVLGFSAQLATGRSSFGAPLVVHVHAFVFFGWTTYYVLQNALIATGSVALHRRLGWIGAGWAAAVVVLGVYMTVLVVRRGTAPFFFEPAYFLLMNSLTVIQFGGLTAAAITLRKRTDWHRRLMLCGMAILTGPAFGRLLPMPLLIPYAGWWVFVAILAFPAIGALRDLRATGRVHRAWWWGIGLTVAVQIVIATLAASAPGLAVYRAVTHGSPGADVDPVAFPAPPGS